MRIHQAKRTTGITGKSLNHFFLHIENFLQIFLCGNFQYTINGILKYNYCTSLMTLHCTKNRCVYLYSLDEDIYGCVAGNRSWASPIFEQLGLLDKLSLYADPLIRPFSKTLRIKNFF